ncbi:MAG: HDOD domain-containing protein [Pseudomonadota bacterium]|nr:HDOD domain-containing protein [Pseudomonadota bacterium]
MISEQVLNALGLARASGSDLSTPQTRARSEVDARQVVRALVLEDDIGRVLLYAGADRFVDLQRIQAVTSRNLRGAPPEVTRELLADMRLESLPALPRISGLPLLIDSEVLEKTEIYVDAGFADQMVLAPRNCYHTHLHEALIDTYSTPIDDLPEPAGGLPPPFDETRLLAATRKFTELRVQQRLEDTLSIPPLSHTARAIMQLQADPTASTAELAQIVEADASLAAQVVGWASSPFYGAKYPVKSVQEAIIRVLGFDLVMNLALGLSLTESIETPQDQPVGFCRYLGQSLYTAALTGALAGAMPRTLRPMHGTAYLAGLLHNYGHLVLAHVFAPHFSLVCRHLEVNPDLGRARIENHLLQMTREEMAAWLLDMWHLPSEVTLAVHHQNDPEYAGEHHAFANLLWLSTRLLRHRGFGDAPLEPIDEALLDRLGIDAPTAWAALDTLMEQRDQLDEILRQLD